MLSVVPQGGYRVTVEVAHDVFGGAREVAVLSGSVAQRLHELVHQASMEGFLLISVVVVLVASRRVFAVEAEGVGGVGVGLQQRPVQTVDVRRTRSGVELRLAGRTVGS